MSLSFVAVYIDRSQAKSYERFTRYHCENTYRAIVSNWIMSIRSFVSYRTLVTAFQYLQLPLQKSCMAD